MNARVSRLIRRAARPYQQPAKHRALWKRLWMHTEWKSRHALGCQLYGYAKVKVTPGGF